MRAKFGPGVAVGAGVAMGCGVAVGAGVGTAGILAIAIDTASSTAACWASAIVSLRSSSLNPPPQAAAIRTITGAIIESMVRVPIKIRGSRGNTFIGRTTFLQLV